MNEQTVSDERLRSIETWAADVSNPNPVLQKTWAAFASHYADDIAAICRELLARREVAAEDAKRLSRVREEVRVEYTKRIERANHLRDEGFNDSQIHLIEAEASCYLRVIGIIDRLTAPAAGASE